jgi:hypothetical protein
VIATPARILVVLASSILVATTAQGQTWPSRLPISKRVYLTLVNGEEVSGRLTSIDLSRLVVETKDGRRQVALDDVRRAEKTDPTWTGAVAGAVVGVAAGLIVIAGDDACPATTSGCRNESSAVPVSGALYGALIGWGLDAWHKGRKTVFTATSSAPPVLSVQASQRGASVAFTVRF